MERNEFLDILTILNHLAHADGEMHPSEKKVLIALFRAAKVTPEEQEQIRRHTSLEEMMEEINSDEAKKALEKDFNPISDMRASRLYRMEVAKNLLEKLCAEIKQKKKIGVYF